MELTGSSIEEKKLALKISESLENPEKMRGAVLAFLRHHELASANAALEEGKGRSRQITGTHSFNYNLQDGNKPQKVTLRAIMPIYQIEQLHAQGKHGEVFKELLEIYHKTSDRMIRTPIRGYIQQSIVDEIMRTPLYIFTVNVNNNSKETATESQNEFGNRVVKTFHKYLTFTPRNRKP